MKSGAKTIMKRSIDGVSGFGQWNKLYVTFMASWKNKSISVLAFDDKNIDNDGVSIVMNDISQKEWFLIKKGDQTESTYIKNVMDIVFKRAFSSKQEEDIDFLKRISTLINAA